MSDTTHPYGIAPLDLIGYYPVGADETRWLGIVSRHYDGGVIVTMTDDPGIEEKVPYDRIKAHKPFEGEGEGEAGVNTEADQ